MTRYATGMDRYRCSECQHVFSDPLKAPNPFSPEETLEFCPECKAVDSSRLLCQASGCDNAASCGEPTPDGYQHVCRRHHFLMKLQP